MAVEREVTAYGIRGTIDKRLFSTEYKEENFPSVRVTRIPKGSIVDFNKLEPNYPSLTSPTPLLFTFANYLL